MKFNPKKCTLLCVTRKRLITKSTYSMMGSNLEQMEHHPYLGVELSAGLEWKHHIKRVTGEAHKTLNFLQRNLYGSPAEIRKQAYISLITPTIEYAAVCWDPYHQKEINSLERVQRKAARFISSNYRRRASVTTMLTHLDLPSLQLRRETARLTMLYKIHHQEVRVEVPSHYAQNNTASVKTRNSRAEQYAIITPRTDAYKHSFFPRTIPEWNRLPWTPSMPPHLECSKHTSTK
jgi:hypothetical protein